MKRNHIFGVFFAVALGVTVSAQSRSAAKPPSPKPISLTGCLTASGPGLTGASATPGRSGGFVLNSATNAPHAPKSYTLLGGDTNALLHFGHSRVEVIGSMDPQPAAAFASASQIGKSPIGAGVTGGVGTSGSGATPATGAVIPPPATAAPPAPTNFHVTSIRQVPGSCGGV
jgi:hypothetical protein